MNETREYIDSRLGQLLGEVEQIYFLWLTNVVRELRQRGKNVGMLRKHGSVSWQHVCIVEPNSRAFTVVRIFNPVSLENMWKIEDHSVIFEDFVVPSSKP